MHQNYEQTQYNIHVYYCIDTTTTYSQVALHTYILQLQQTHQTVSRGMIASFCTEWSMTRSAGHSGLILAGSPLRSSITS